MAQNPKDGSGNTPIGARKTSLSGYSTTSGNVSRPGTRRRDTSDSFPANGPLSPSENKTFFQSNTATPPPALLRRRTDFKEEEPSPNQKEPMKEDDDDDDDDDDNQLPFGSLRRIGTAPANSAQNPSSASPWSAGPNSSGFGNMGSFGSFNVSSAQDSSEKRPGFGSARGGSRFKDLLAKTSTEDMNIAKDRPMFGGLEKLPEEDADAVQSRMRDFFKTRPNRSETNPYEDAPARTGSAAMSASQDGGASAHGIEYLGFSAFSAARDFGGDSSLNPALPRYSGHEPLSPAHTNPYQSPHGPPHDDDDHNTNDSASQHALPPFGPTRRSLFDSESSSRAFGGLPGFGPWSSAGFGSGTPARDRNVSSSGFGDPIFNPPSDLQSPGAGLGGGFFGAGGAFGTAGRSSRLGAMFPPAMQDQMRGEGRNDVHGPSFGSRPESAQQDIGGRDPFDSMFARGSGAFGSVEDATPRASDGAPGFGLSGGTQQPIGAAPANQRASTGSDLDQGQPGQDGQMPAAQQRQMVMPDRMRWIYRDPQGAIQGPWSGLEMHDWFKAGFFTAELLVRKVEDVEFEPLAQLVRRIGNSREPFLVPQIGLPHGPTSATVTNWPNPAAATGTQQPGNAQPPFASAFPSFGTTLTAEQQNALERRKQEEQYLMARQKEHLAQQQVFMRQQQIPPGSHNINPGLQHHSSQQSLHSQPSFGSIASPNAGPFQSPMPSHQPLGAPPTSSGNQPPFGREDELHGMMDRLSFNQRMNIPPGNGPLGAPPGEGPPGMTHMLQDRARLQQQQGDMRSHQDAFLGPQGRNDRLEEFNELRGQAEAGLPGLDSILPQPIGAQRQQEEPQQKQPAPIGYPGAIQKPTSESQERASLREQIQRQAEWQEQQPLQPPPASISPLPAPAAQRNRQHVADSLVPEPRSETQTPIETPTTSLAPWAQQPAEVSKGPSLREIQEAEAKKTAEQEAIAAEARRVQAEHERLSIVHMPPPAPGLPSTSTWGQSSSPGTPTGPATSVWAKPPAKPTSTASSKKTLAQIQKEEEARKHRQVAAAAAASAQAASPAGGVQGKRYAELASKAASIPSPIVPGAAAGAWTTVGSSGKAKMPIPATVVAAPQPSAINRTTSGAVATSAVKKPSLTTAVKNTNTLEKNRAEEEFRKWLRGQVSKGLNAGISVDDFVSTMISLPAEADIIADSVYSASQVLDGRRIAEEFVRRRKAADKGIVMDAGAGTNGSVSADAGVKSGEGGGGWSEVAKKGPASAAVAGGEKGQEAGGREEFKVVAGKKKGKR